MGSRGQRSASASAGNEYVNEFKHYVQVNGEDTIKAISHRVKSDVEETEAKISQLERKVLAKNIGPKKKATLRQELARQRLYLKEERTRLDAVKELGWA